MGIHENIAEMTLGMIDNLNRSVVKDFKVEILDSSQEPFLNNNNGLDLLLTIEWAMSEEELDDSDSASRWIDTMKIVIFNMGYTIQRQYSWDANTDLWVLRHDTERQQLQDCLDDRFEHLDHLTFRVRHVGDVVKHVCKTTRLGGYNVVAQSDIDCLLCDDFNVQRFINELGYSADTVFACHSGTIRDWTVRKK